MNLVMPNTAKHIVSSLLHMCTLLFRDRVKKLVDGVADADGGAIPRWPLATVYTGCMVGVEGGIACVQDCDVNVKQVGAHSCVIITDAYFRGVPIANITFAMEVDVRDDK
jgi:hypothetical protein